MGDKASVQNEINAIVDLVCQQAQPGDEILIMSNGGFWRDSSTNLNGIGTTMKTDETHIALALTGASGSVI